MADLLVHIKPQIDQARHSAPVSDDEARRESNAGFKKVSEEHQGRGGATKYQVSQLISSSPHPHV